MNNDEFVFGATTTQPGEETPENPVSQEDHPDVVSMDVPTLIRVMEWAHEDANDDVQLHQFANALILASFRHSPLDIDDYQEVYDAIVSNESSSDAGTSDVPTQGEDNQGTIVFQN